MDYNILVNKDNPLPRAHIPNTLVDTESERKKGNNNEEKLTTLLLDFFPNSCYNKYVEW